MAEIRPFRGWRYTEKATRLSETVGARPAGGSASAESGEGDDGSTSVGIRTGDGPLPLDISSLCAPPYDVLDRAERNALAALSRRNVVELELPDGSDDPDSPDSRYGRSMETWRRWISDGTLEQDAEPAIYMLEQRFTTEEGGPEYARICFIAEMSLYPFEEKVVIPHELTLPKALGDRYSLLSATNVNYSQVLGLYSDKTDRYDRVVQAVRESEPVSIAEDGAGVRSTLWMITDSQSIDLIVQSLEGKQVFIADGHHRYTVALAWRDRCRKGIVGADSLSEAADPPEATCPSGPAEASEADGGIHRRLPTDSLMIALANMDDPQLRILAYNRAVKMPEGSGFDPSAMFESMDGRFTIEVFGRATADDEKSIIYMCEACQSRILEIEDPAFGVAIRAEDPSDNQSIPQMTIDFAVVSLKPDLDLNEAIPSHHTLAWKELDVSVLQELVISPIFNIDSDRPETLSRISYSQHAGKLVDGLISGKSDAVFIMRPTRLDQLESVSLGGETMPQKSTFFYPKLPSGLVFRDMNE